MLATQQMPTIGHVCPCQLVGNWDPEWDGGATTVSLGCKAQPIQYTAMQYTVHGKGPDRVRFTKNVFVQEQSAINCFSLDLLYAIFLSTAPVLVWRVMCAHACHVLMNSMSDVT